MAHEDSSDRTESATPRRRQEARDEGRVARSADLNAAVGLLAGLALLYALGPRIGQQFVVLLQDMEGATTPDGAGLLTDLRRAGMATAMAIGPFLAGLICVAVAAGLAQTGPLAVWKKLTPEFDKVNPVTGLRRLFSLESLTRLVMGLLKMTLVGAVAYYALKSQFDRALAIAHLDVSTLLTACGAITFNVGLKIAIALLILAIIDFLLEKWKLERSLRMTKQEIRDEMKNMEGDPHIRQRRRQIQARIAMQRVQRDVPKADVVVTNPTHFAVALKYDSKSMGAPRVLVKGQDLIALRIRQLALQHGIPVVERPSLARALYAGVEVGQEVPPNLYRAVAEVLAYVYQLTRRSPQFAAS